MASTNPTAATTSSWRDDPVVWFDQCARYLGAFDVSAMAVSQLEAVVAGLRWLQRTADGLMARAAVRAAELRDDGLGPGPDGLLTGRGEVAAITVRAEAARADAARAMPALGSALAAGRIGADHIDVVAGVLKKTSEAERVALAALDAGLAVAAAGSSPESFQRRVYRALARIRDQLGVGPDEAKESELRWWWGRDNMGRLAGKLTAEQHERLVNALGDEMSAMARRANGAPESVDGPVAPVALDAHLAAEALVNRVTATAIGTGVGGRASITIVVDADTALTGTHDSSLCETAAGGALPWETVNRCACDAVIRRVVLDDHGVPIDVGRAYRTATPAQWSALTALYTGCAWYGCDRPLAWCQAHHVVYWDDQGPTDIDNLIPLCGHHHHLVHECGWRLALSNRRDLQHIQPDGAHWRTSHPDRQHHRRSRHRAGTAPCPSHTDIGGHGLATSSWVDAQDLPLAG